MNKTQLQALLSANGVDFKSTDTVAILQKLVKDNNLSETSTDDSDDDVVVQRRPAPSPAIQDGTNKLITGADILNIRWKYNRPYTTAVAQEKHPDGFDAFLYKKGSVEIPFITDDKQFIADFKAKEIHSLVLTANVTGEMLPATVWDEARPEVRWEANTIITKKDRAYYRSDAFQDFVFNPSTFISNPELLSKSGILDKIMEESV